MRARTHAGTAYVSDELPLLYFYAALYALSKTARMRIQRLVAADMPDDDDLAVAAFGSDEFNRSVAGRLYRSAFGSAVIHAQMRFITL